MENVYKTMDTIINIKYSYGTKNNNFTIAVNYSAYTLFTYAQLKCKYALKHN